MTPLLAAALLVLGEPTPTPPSLPFRSTIVSEESGGERVTLPEGARLHAEPDARSVSLAVVDAEAELAVVERRGRWVRVSWNGLKGWVLEGEETAAAATLGAGLRAPEPRRERLEEARRLMGRHAGERALGPFACLTDVRDGALLEILGKTAASVEAAYRSRFGVDAGLPHGEVVVLFARESTYRAFERQEPSIAGLEAMGHAGSGLAALRAEGLDRDELRGVLTHELTHLLNRRAGLQLPAWLEEGMAEDLGYCRFDAEGRPVPGTLRARLASDARTIPAAGGGRMRFTRVSLSGPQAAVNDVVEGGSRRATPVADLLGMPWRTLVTPENRPRTYPLSALLVRYLLDGENGSRAGALRLFLGSRVASAGSSEALLALLEPDPALRAQLTASLESGFAAWLPRQRLAVSH